MDLPIDINRSLLFSRREYERSWKLLNYLFNLSLAMILFVLALPFFILIPIMIKMQGSGPILYRGGRLGLNKKIFMMYKFRTLAPHAEKIIGDKILTKIVGKEENLVTHFGNFLRETRLDELPQLINVIKGDMDLVGPRPERPGIYKKHCQHLPTYDKRFLVNPALIGYAQLFTPHETPRVIRMLIDNKFLHMKKYIVTDLSLIFFAAIALMSKCLTKTARFVWRSIRSREEKRGFDRVPLKNTVVYLGLTENGSFDSRVRAVDINERAVRLTSESEIKSDEFVFMIQAVKRQFFNRRNKVKSVYCQGKVYRSSEVKNPKSLYHYVVDYNPLTPLNGYKISKYLLQDSII